MPKILVCAALLLLSTRPSYAQWERVVVAWTGEGDMVRPAGHGTPHSLQYYLAPSAERDPINSFCLGCPIAAFDGPKLSLQDYVVDRSQRTLGESYGRKIVEIVLTFDETPEVQEMADETNSGPQIVVAFQNYVAPFDAEKLIRRMLRITGGDS